MLVYKSIGSTNRSAISYLEAGEPVPAWILAQNQTEGRGRQGRTWCHGPGNFAGSLLWPAPKQDPTSPAAPSFLAALAVRETLIDFGASADLVTLKWPNDVLAAGRKIAGILVERLHTEDPARAALVVGIGVNLKVAPQNTGQPVASLVELVGDYSIGLAEFATQLDAKWRSWWEIYQTNGFEPARQAWSACAQGLGEMVTVSNGGEVQRRGRFTGIDRDGAALVESNGDLHRVLAGDVTFRVDDRARSDG